MAGRAAFGTLFKMGATPTTVAHVTEIGGIGVSTEILDVTAMDSGGAYREILPSFLTGKDIKLKVNWVPDAATHKNASGGVWYAMEQKALTAFQIVFPTATTATYSFSGYITGIEGGGSFDKKLEADITITPSGAGTWAYA